MNKPPWHDPLWVTSASMYVRDRWLDSRDEGELLNGLAMEDKYRSSFYINRPTMRWDDIGESESWTHWERDSIWLTMHESVKGGWFGLPNHVPGRDYEGWPEEFPANVDLQTGVERNE